MFTLAQMFKKIKGTLKYHLKQRQKSGKSNQYVKDIRTRKMPQMIHMYF